MAPVLDRSRHPDSGTASERGTPRAVVLATLAVRVAPDAEAFALASAMETRAPLIVANMLAIPPYPMTFVLAREHATLPFEEDLEAVRATAQRAAAAGIATQLLRVSSRRPVRALLELARERDAGLLVFGPDRRLLPRWRFRTAARAVRRDAPCLVWLGD
jgi:nucleotide-binding universal stress UspA family protein